MNINGIRQNTGAQAPSRQSNSRLESLDKQISNLQKNIQDVHKNEKLDPKTKMEKVKEYQDQIQMIQQEKAQIQAEERQSKLKANENKQPSVAQEEQSKNRVVDKNVQNAFVKMESAKNTVNELGVVREQIKGELRIAESESFLRASDPVAAAKAREKLAKIDGVVLRKGAQITDDLEAASYESASSKERPEQEESNSENIKSGTGRMEPGQFLDDEA